MPPRPVRAESSALTHSLVAVDPHQEGSAETMGELYEAVCSDCGYRAEGLQEDGVGLIGDFMEPMVCRNCREVVTVVVADLFSQMGPDLNSCPGCGGTRLAALSKLALGEQASAHGFRLRRRANCPRCGGWLAIAPTGHWG